MINFPFGTILGHILGHLKIINFPFGTILGHLKIINFPFGTILGHLKKKIFHLEQMENLLFLGVPKLEYAKYWDTL